MQNSKRLHLFTALLILVVFSACANNDNSHTTATTYVSPPPVQVLTVVRKAVAPPSITKQQLDPTADPTKPLLVFHLENGKKFRVGEEVPIEFSVQNAKLKGDGGEFRVRYITDDDEMKWLDTIESFWLTGWTPGKHTIRIELIGPDHWPYKNGNANIVTREITVAN